MGTRLKENFLCLDLVKRQWAIRLMLKKVGRCVACASLGAANGGMTPVSDVFTTNYHLRLIHAQ